MIVRDAAADLERCLASVEGLFHEQVIVNTGSVDETCRVATEYGARVLQFPWCDDFSAARNFGLRHARGDWVMWLDADEWLAGDQRAKLHELQSSHLKGGSVYVLQQVSLSGANGLNSVSLDQVRLFPRHPEIRWEGRVHEQLTPSTTRCGLREVWTDIRIEHSGYVDERVLQSKLQRNRRLLEWQRQERPNDPLTLLTLGTIYQEFGRLDDALECALIGFEQVPINHALFPQLCTLASRLHRQRHDYTLAIACGDAGLLGFPNDASLLYETALACHAAAQFDKAEALLRHLLGSWQGRYYSATDLGLRGPKGQHALAIVLRDRGDLKAAEAIWRMVTEQHPDFTPAWRALGELLIRTNRVDQANSIVERLARTECNSDVAITLQVHLHLATGLPGAAVELLEGLVARNSLDVVNRLWLSDIHARVIHDRQRAIALLNEVLRLEPNHPVAQNNLEILKAAPS